ncbi:hypothetical protein [Streptomyces sp. NPDC006527]|uniref:hypothetical protein n=1 Tax=Streptomyces sp. NPDC006527 TaxID=3364749 RepID=UPI00367D5D94
MTSDTPASPHDAMTSLDNRPRFDVTHWPLRVEEYLRKTQNPLHRAMLRNYYRHLLLELSDYWDQILLPEPTVDEPAYRATTTAPSPC